MLKVLKRFLFLLFLLIIIDQSLKIFIVSLAFDLNNIELDYITHIFETKIISISLVFNKGVAFSFLSQFTEYLKYFQVFLIIFLFIFVMSQKNTFQENYILFAFIFSGGISNILDRFTYGGVVDYVYWHYKFDFAIFNLADVLINIGIGIYLLKIFIGYLKKNSNSY